MHNDMHDVAQLQKSAQFPYYPLLQTVVGFNFISWKKNIHVQCLLISTLSTCIPDSTLSTPDYTHYVAHNKS